MAKIDEIKSKSPDSRLTPLATSFRPGQRRIALPTSRFSGEPDTTSKRADQTDAIASENKENLIKQDTISKTNFTSSGDSPNHSSSEFMGSKLPELTRHNSTQLNEQISPTSTLPTRHNSTQNSSNEIDLNGQTAEFEPINPAQLDTDLSKKTPNLKDINSAQLKNSSKKVTIKSGKAQSSTRHNSAQPDTGAGTTRHINSAHLGTPNEPKLTLNSSLEKLSGNSAKIVSYLAHKCIQSNSNIVTMSYQMLAAVLQVKVGSIPTTCKRLKKLKVFDISGPGGGEKAVRIFKLNDSTLKEFSRISILSSGSTFELTAQLDTTRHTNPTQPDTGAGTNASSMYVGNINNTIHTESTPAHSPPTEIDPWSELREVDFAPLAHWGIKGSVVETFKKNRWIIERVQLEDLIEQFVRYFSEPEYEQRRAAVKNPYSIFLNCIKCLAKGEPHAISDVPTDFEIQTKVAQLNLLARQQEQTKRLEEIEKLKQSQAETIFQQWVADLSIDEQLKLVPAQPMAKPGSVAYRQLLKAYFVDEVWSKDEQSFLNAPRA